MNWQRWALITPVLWCRAAQGAELETFARAVAENPTASSRASLRAYAAAHPKDRDGALALLALAIDNLRQGAHAEARRQLGEAGRRLPVLADYAAWFRASSLIETKEWAAATQALAPLWNSTPSSPLVARAAPLAVDAHLERNTAPEAASLLRTLTGRLPEAQWSHLMARALEASGDSEAALTHFERVYFEFPLSPQAADAGSALPRLRAAVPGHTPVRPDVQLRRALLLLEAGQHRQARTELSQLLPQLEGPAQDLARVRIGAADYQARLNQAAYSYLEALSPTHPEAAAERLYYLLAAARRLEREERMLGLLDELLRSHPRSPWRMEALISTGNHFLVKNETARYEPIFRTAALDFPDHPRAPYAHWKAAWNEYFRRGASAGAMLQEHVTKWPASPHTSAALYYLGRLAHAADKTGEARAFYAKANQVFPNHFYALLARQRLAEAGEPAASRVAWLDAASFPAPRQAEFQPAEAANLRIQRARLLGMIGQDEFAEAELRFGARADGPPSVYAMALAQSASRRGEPAQAIKYIKSVLPSYIALPLENAPAAFWRLAFPMPYRDALERNATANQLDPFLVAALIRQESEFDRKVISRANAWGLTQVVPRTGRELSRKTGMKRFTNSMLFDPEINLKLGTYYLRSLLNSLQGNWEATLAAYNAGKSRADRWLAQGPYRETAEFIENIPFTETRDYVQIVLRNADFYRRLYGSTPPAAKSAN